MTEMQNDFEKQRLVDLTGISEDKLTELQAALEQKRKISDRDQFEAIDYGERLLAIQDRSIAYAALFQFCDSRADIRWIDDEFHSRVTTPERLYIFNANY
mmetsp:Transcript_13631/g.20754  ORF Transcript_13631/g.20754 Transcript_13631/m.20754 type:complete len:100 (+) Transcript_13631:124-423(+)